MENSCIISYASHGRENYNKAMLRLIESINEINWQGETILYSFDGYIDEYKGIKIRLCNSIKTPQPEAWVAHHHSEIPYQFKPAIFQIAVEEGNKKVFWCDSTVKILKDPSSLFEQSESGIIAFENLGHPLWNWISDDAQKILQISDEELKTIPQIMACVIGFDFTKSKARDIFDEWVIRATDGISFADKGSAREGFKAHRHDQAVLSALLWKYKVPLLPYGKLVYHDETKEYGSDIYFVNKGMGI